MKPALPARPRLLSAAIAGNAAVALLLGWQAILLAADVLRGGATAWQAGFLVAFVAFAILFVLLGWGLAARRGWARAGEVVVAGLLFAGLIPAFSQSTIPSVLLLAQQVLAAFLLAAMLSQRVKAWMAGLPGGTAGQAA